MPTKRTPVTRARRGPPIIAEWWAMLTDSDFPDDGNFFARFEFDEHAAALWAAHGPAILKTWIVDRHGSRPSMWWRFQAPRLREIPAECRGWFFEADLIEPRLLLSGAGRPEYEVSNLVPRFVLGIPVDWHGFDADDPPRFESQFDYLRRHSLLAPGERRSSSEPAVELVTYWTEENHEQH